MDTMIIKPEELGYYERRRGYGIWYHPYRGSHAYSPRICENPDSHCQEESSWPFAGRAKADSARYRAQSKRPRSVTQNGMITSAMPVARPASMTAWIVADRPVTGAGFTAGMARASGTTNRAAISATPGLGGYDDESHPRGESHYRAKLTEA
jgi:hypothetical protein